MKTGFLFFAISVFSLFPGCQKDAENLTEGQITFVKTIPGGCNSQAFGDIKRSLNYPDTVRLTLNKDTLDIFVGMNYICCAPFVAEAEIVDNSVIMTLEDTCSESNHGCYCKCMCYYTWDFLFTDFEDQDYNYKVVLIDPRTPGPVVFREGTLSLP